MASLRALLIKREGDVPFVYLDKLKLPTVGIGHRVVPADKLILGDRVDPRRIADFFRQDTAVAMAAARAQATKAKIKDADFIIYLAAVNFQLGSGWFRKFKKTWALITERKYREAAVEVQKSKWYGQTPVRVKDFQGALLRLAGQSGKDGGSP